MRVYRISKTKYANDLTGTGARLVGGRWNPRGQALLYTSENRALAALEFLVHLERVATPEEYSLMTIEIPDTIQKTVYLPEQLPANWQEYPSPQSTIALGGKWLQEAKTLLLRVPSTLITKENNYLINPLHEDFRLIRLLETERFNYDNRLLI